jgi:FOG: HEAT repeat
VTVTAPPSPSQPPVGQLREPELLEPPFSPARVEELLRLVSKAARAHQLYLPNNPIYRNAIEALRAGFAPLWAEIDELPLTITEHEIRWFDAPVAGGNNDATGGGKSPDNLAWLFYKDGVRELNLLKGFEQEEVAKLLQLIQRARKGSADEDDLVTMLWEADFTFLQYKFIDLLQDGSGGELADGGGATPSSAADIQRGAKEAVAEAATPGFVSMADFDGTLYFLDDREIEYIRGEVQREYEQDLRLNIINVLFDIFEAQNDITVRGEVVDNLQTLMVYLLAAGHFRGVARLLHETQVAIGRATDLSSEHRDRLSQLSERLSAPEALSQLLQALDEAPTLPPEHELTELFDQLRPTGLATVLQWTTRIRNDRLRPLFEAVANRLAGANTAELVRLIQSPDVALSSEAIRRAGALKAQAAVLALSKVLGEPEAARRQLAVHALTEIASPGALQALERMIEDPDRDVRIGAVRALSSRGYRPVLARLETVIRGKAVRETDLTEKMAFFEAYGLLCGDGGIGQLDSALNGKGFLGRREDPEIRACAAVALGRVGTPKAMETLRKAATEKDIVVRNAVTRALRGGASS